MASDTELSAQPNGDPWLGLLLFERYRVVRRVASGGMGLVYEARHEQLGRKFALKFLNPKLDADPKMRARFLREARAAGAVDNEHVCAIVDVGLGPEDAPCIVMEYLEGENLAALLERDGPLLVPRAVDIVRQVCRGLASAHARGVIHRDLKPKNLIVCRRSDGRELVKIVDFGIAKLSERDVTESAVTTTGATMGTPHYMSPEQARGEKELDQRADIYSLGVILYELLSGQKPHPGDSYNAIIYHILSRTPVPLREHRADVPEALARIVHRSLESDPKDRFASAGELEKALAAHASTFSVPLSSGESTVASAAAPALAPRRSGNRRLVMGVGAAAVVAIVLAWRWNAGPEASPAAMPEPIASSAPAPEPSPASSEPTAMTNEAPPVAASPSSVEPPAPPPPKPKAPLHTVHTPPAPAPAKPSASAPRVPIDFSNPYQ
jgi:serine/threonine protein kinase